MDKLIWGGLGNLRFLQVKLRLTTLPHKTTYQAYLRGAYVEPRTTSICIGLYEFIVPGSTACRPGTTTTYGMVVQGLRGSKSLVLSRWGGPDQFRY